MRSHTDTNKGSNVTQKAVNAGKDGQQRKDKLPFWKVALSIAQAGFGVQSHANRERDFGQGSIGTYVAAALIFTAVFVLSLLLIVRLVLGEL